VSKVLQRNTLDSQLQHESWRATYESEYKANAQILASYYERQPYYIPMAIDILAGKIPERSKFLRMYQNKYSTRVLEQAHANPKYEKGAYLIPRARFDSYKSVETESDLPWMKQKEAIAAFKVRGGFVMEVCKDIRSAAAGAKRYKLLPIGQTTPLIVEERFLKISRRKK
jgi:light-regulated signal transduction histidine kinase (bacteriophytochrome)